VDLVTAQIDETDPLGIHEVLEHVLFLQDFHLVCEDAEHRHLARLLRSHHLEQPFVGLLEILESHEVVIDQGRAEQAIGAHHDGTVLGSHGSDFGPEFTSSA
jgi:hypothetical protein